MPTNVNYVLSSEFREAFHRGNPERVARLIDKKSNLLDLVEMLEDQVAATKWSNVAASIARRAEIAARVTDVLCDVILALIPGGQTVKVTKLSIGTFRSIGELIYVAVDESAKDEEKLEKGISTAVSMGSLGTIVSELGGSAWDAINIAKKIADNVNEQSAAFYIGTESAQKQIENLKKKVAQLDREIAASSSWPPQWTKF